MSQRVIAAPALLFGLLTAAPLKVSTAIAGVPHVIVNDGNGTLCDDQLKRLVNQAK